LAGKRLNAQSSQRRKDRKGKADLEVVMPYEEEIAPYGNLTAVPPELESLARAVIGAAIEVHRELGPGMPEDGYQKAMAIELALRQIPSSSKGPSRCFTKDCGSYGKIDILVAGILVVEIKVVDASDPYIGYKL